jgi:hypothetical protein
LEFLLGLTNWAFLGWEFHRTHDHILLSIFWNSPQAEGPSLSIYFHQEQDSPVIAPGTGFPFRRLLQLIGIDSRDSNSSPLGEPGQTVSYNKSNMSAWHQGESKRCNRKTYSEK